MKVKPPIGRIFLECTCTHSTGINTGIQRVVRNLCGHAPHVGARLGVECSPVISVGGRLIVITGKLGRPLGSLPEAVLPVERVPRWLRRVGVRLHKALFPRTLYRYAVSLAWRHQGRERLLGPGDLLVLLDSSWWQADLLPLVARAKEQGARIGVLIHDLIPLSHSGFHSPEFADIFRQWLDTLAGLADFFIANSATTRDALRQYLQQKHPERNWHRVPLLSFRLGCSLDLLDCSGDVRAEVQAALAGHDQAPTYLTVGTIEPRKNHRLILDAFAEVWQTQPQTRLCIVGRIGWSCDELIREIRRHPRLGTTLFLFTDLSDVELQYCYRQARALLYASQVEGFGLPIVEALQHRLPVLASDTPVHREVGQDSCAYFDVHSPRALARLVLDREERGCFPPLRYPEALELPDWQASTHEFLERCLDAVRSIKRQGKKGKGPCPRPANSLTCR